MNDKKPSSVGELLSLAKSKRADDREILFGNITDLFLSEDARLTDRERALMASILQKLVKDIEMEVRRALAKSLASNQEAPSELIGVLVNDEIEIAQPILLRSSVLTDPDLIRIIRFRGREHWLAISMRSPLSEFVSEAIVATGDEDAIERLLKNQDAELSQRAMEYLVAESERVDRFQEPLLKRHDLPPELAIKMYWWVSAALRQYMVRTYKMSELSVDQMVEETTARLTRALPSEAKSADQTAAALIDRLSQKNELNPQNLIKFLRSGRIGAFIAGVSHMAGLDGQMMRQIVFEAGGESLAITCKAMGWQRTEFANVFLLSRQFQGTHQISPARLEEALKFFDDVTEPTANSILHYWRRDPRYARAIDEVGEAPSEPS